MKVRKMDDQKKFLKKSKHIIKVFEKMRLTLLQDDSILSAQEKKIQHYVPSLINWQTFMLYLNI